MAKTNPSFPHLVCDRQGNVLSSHATMESATAEVHKHAFWTYIEHMDESYVPQD